MKRFLLCFALLASITSLSKVNAQCSVSNVSITPTNIDITNCQLTFNLSYTLDVNNGSKYSVVHFWTSASYPSPAPTAGQYPLPTAQTGGMLGTIIIKNPGGPASGNNAITLLQSWPQDGATYIGATPSTPILYPSAGGTFGISDYGSGPSARRVYNFTGLKMPIPNCTQTVVLKGDVWATQTNSQGSSCLASGVINITANEPGVRAFMACSAPRSVTVSFNTLSANNITFSVYKDANANGVFDPADVSAGKLNVSGPNIVGTTQNVTVASPAKPINVYDNTNTFGPYVYDQQPSGSKYNVWIVARATGNNYDNILLVQNSCALLPVTFKSFTATRSKQSVSLKWETSSELNNKGFYVQSNADGTWKTLGFVSSQAHIGSSTETLSYAYNDLNTNRSVTQYRIQQVDMDGKSKYSDIRIIQGEGQSKKLLVFPNPSQDGKVNISFDDASAKNITISDVAGRIIKSYKNVNSGSLVIDNLQSGFYNVQVKDLSTNLTVTEKIIVSKK